MNEQMQQVGTEIDRVANKILETIKDEPLTLVISALTYLASGAIIGQSSLTPEQKKAGAMFLFNVAVNTTIQAGVDEKEITSAMCEPTFYSNKTH